MRTESSVRRCRGERRTRTTRTKGLAARGGLLLLGLTTGLALTGCGDDGVGPAGGGTMSAQLTDPAGSGTAASVARAGLLPLPLPPLFALQSGGEFSGDFSAEAEVEVSADGEVWVSLGPPRQVEVTLQSDGETTTVHTDATVPAESFTRVRITLREPVARLDAGSSVGGLTLSAAAQLQVGADGEVVIEKEIEPVSVSADSRTTLRIDLRSELWVTRENVEARTVSEAELEQATAVEVR